MAIFNSYLNVYQRVKKSTTCKGGRRLRLSDIQFSLCEFDKYQRCHAGGRVRCRIHPVRNSVLKTILQLWRGWGKDLTNQCTNAVQICRCPPRNGHTDPFLKILQCKGPHLTKFWRCIPTTGERKLPSGNQIWKSPISQEIFSLKPRFIGQWKFQMCWKIHIFHG